MVTGVTGDMECLTITSNFRSGGGTFPYISPEQQDPHRSPMVEYRADIYSLGIILFELHLPKVLTVDEHHEVCVCTLHSRDTYLCVGSHHECASLQK